jgi:selenocysteine lyase/cysteine desulfurase
MKALIETHRPRLVSLTHIPTNSGVVQPVEEVGEICKELDIVYLLDACQSAGQWPVDVTKIHCDLLSVTMRKFLRGPRGAGFLYVSDKVLDREMEPLFIDMRGANWIGADQYVLHSRGRRFEDWEVPHALVLGSKVAIEYALAVGIENIKQRNAHLGNVFKQQLAKIKGARLLDIGTPQSSIITLTLPVEEPANMVQTLRNKNINTSMATRSSALIDFDSKGTDWALRISPHYYNSNEEVGILVESLSQMTDK